MIHARTIGLSHVGIERCRQIKAGGVVQVAEPEAEETVAVDHVYMTICMHCCSTQVQAGPFSNHVSKLALTTQIDSQNK